MTTTRCSGMCGLSSISWRSRAGRESEAIPSRTDRQALRALAQSTTATDIGFLIATLPDYIDSNSGWMADEIMGGIQAAMAQSDLVLDRFVLPELTRPDDKGPGRNRRRQPPACTSASRAR